MALSVRESGEHMHAERPAPNIPSHRDRLLDLLLIWNHQRGRNTRFGWPVTQTPVDPGPLVLSQLVRLKLQHQASILTDASFPCACPHAVQGREAGWR